ncbi:chaperone NapD [Campylobacter sp. US33a]|uniref:Chaperone NapD n=1 Tax=Campylobacter sp. CCS1377 TaxID=3158229 RepID=A0AAU7E620_9BACT|nr:chaperone NapD [Campylobacter sp. US33a]MCW1360338.1 chaperone NapD [Campylobacter jejuni]TEY01585.1 oxidoreductase [Campylobacter sp. US33a]
MNLSSVLLRIKQEHQSEILQSIQKIKYCSVEICDQDKIIVVIESESLDDELKAYRQLEQLPKIISINMIFSYQDLDDIKINDNENIKLNDENQAENITYYGDIYRKY